MNLRARIRLVILSFAIAVASSETVRAQRALAPVSLPGESRATADRLAAVDKLAEEKQWPEAVEEYLHILEEAGDDLVPLDRFHDVVARRLCHLRLAALPAPILRLYRERVDPQAKQWLEQGKAERDPKLLRRLVDETFCSRFTDQAIDLLGDLAFERGRFEEAKNWWDMLVPPAEPGDAGVRALATGDPRASALGDQDKSLRLVYPDPQVDLARVRGKQILAKLFQGDRGGLTEALKDFQAKHGKSEGALAGRQGKYADILEALARDPRLASEVERRKNEPRPWPTFAGDCSRNSLPAAAPCRLVLESPPWPIRLDGKPAGPDEFLAGRRLLKPSPAPRGPGLDLDYYPVIAGDLVLIANSQGHSVSAYDLITGRQKGKFDLLEDLKGPPLGQLDLSIPAQGAFGFTLTVSDNRVYARLGTGKRDSFLVCLDLPPQNGKLIPRWFVSSNDLPASRERQQPDPETSAALFEGAPAVRDGRVYLARTRVEKLQTTTEIDCFDAETGKLRWRQEACIGQQADAGQPWPRHHLLTLAAGNVVYCSHSGAVIALDGRTGKRVWAARYPSRGLTTENGTPSPRDLAPCVYASGRVFVAPADFAGVLCLDADTGQKIWEKDQIEVVHLLGVARGRLIFTTGRKPRGIQGLDAATGKESRKWFQPESEGELPSFGRGFLAGDYVFWPTQPNPHLPRLPSLRVLNQEDGQLPPDIDPEQYWQIQPGNMAYGNGCLAVADQERLYVYVPPGRLLEERRKDAAAQPDSAPASYRLALAEADAGLAAQALDDFARTERLAQPEERWDGFSLRELARSERHRLLLDLARREWVEKKHLDDSHLEKAAGSEFSASERLQALRRKAEWLEEAKRFEQAVAVWQGILDDESLRGGQMVDGHGHPQQAASYAADQISGLIKSHGAAVYQVFEQRAGAELNVVPENCRFEVLEQLGRRFPHASMIRSALLQDAVAQEKAGRPALAAREYRCLLLLHEEDKAQTMAREGLARIGHDVEDVLAAQSMPDLKLPLVQRWQASLSPGECLLRPLPFGSPRLVFADGAHLICREIGQNTPCWKRPLAASPFWMGSHADLIVVGAAKSIHGFQLADGRELWRFADPNLPPLGVSPRRLPGHPERSEGSRQHAVEILRCAQNDRGGGWGEIQRGGTGGEADDFSFGQFHLTGGLVFFLQGNRRLFAIEVDTGRVLWTRWAPGGQIRPAPPDGEFACHFHADPKWVALQTTAGRCLLLESLTGRVVVPPLGGETATGGFPFPSGQAARTPNVGVAQTPPPKGGTTSPSGGELWLQAPLLIGHQQVCMVVGSRRIATFDLATGRELWQVQTPLPGTTAQPPQLFGDGKRLFCLVDGWQLSRLNPANGQTIWECSTGTEPLSADTMALDQEGAYYVSRNVLQARSAADGHLLWSLQLPKQSVPWKLVAARDYILAFPSQAPRQMRWGIFLGSHPMSFPLEIHWDNFPVLVCDKKEAKIIHRMDFPGDGPQAAVHCHGNGLIIVRGERIIAYASDEREKNRATITPADGRKPR